MEVLAQKLRTGTIEIEDAIHSERLPNSVLFEFARVCGQEIISRGVMIEENKLREACLRNGCGTWCSRADALGLGWLEQICTQAGCDLWAVKSALQRSSALMPCRQEAEELASTLSDLELSVASRQAVQSRRKGSGHIEEWYAARRSARVRQLHVMATLIDSFQQQRRVLCALLLRRKASLQRGLEQAHRDLEKGLFDDHGPSSLLSP